MTGRAGGGTGGGSWGGSASAPPAKNRRARNGIARASAPEGKYRRIRIGIASGYFGLRGSAPLRPSIEGHARMPPGSGVAHLRMQGIPGARPRKRRCTRPRSTR
eukprot:scaffold19030_cov62-Isochrysis_galbana.AAC.1